MMTKATLKTLWFAGGGVIATWLAVVPNTNAPSPSSTMSAERPVASREPSAEELNTQAEKLREHLAGPLRPSTRNPFRFASPKAGASTGVRATDTPVAVAPPAPLTPPPPTFTLSGIAERNTPEGRKRTAIISGDGQLYLVDEGEAVAGLYTVVTIDADAVLLRDQTGSELRLALR